ncbi:MAG: SAM-dependent methyltransferase [Anaerolineae bacterium]|nr:MAG: SAM-dependent methyltransferase [Anaerolineae bacterium]
MSHLHSKPIQIEILTASGWQDYALLDSGKGLRLEQYGPFRLVRPASQAMWRPALDEREWQAAHAIFQPSGGESGGQWHYSQSPLPDNWQMSYRTLKFQVFTGGSRHVGVFVEQSPQWDWISETVQSAGQPLQVLNLFAYSGLATLAAAAAGAKVTHVDASKKIVELARRNQALSGLADKPIRWIVDDALKFLKREIRRGVRYDGMILDPPKFGRGPKGEVWEFFDLLPNLLELCRQALSPRPRFFVLTAYAIQASALSLYYAVQDFLALQGGEFSCGELTLAEKSNTRLLPMAIYVRWRK